MKKRPRKSDLLPEPKAGLKTSQDEETGKKQIVEIMIGQLGTAREVAVAAVEAVTVTATEVAVAAALLVEIVKGTMKTEVAVAAALLVEVVKGTMKTEEVEGITETPMIGDPMIAGIEMVNTAEAEATDGVEAVMVAITAQMIDAEVEAETMAAQICLVVEVETMAAHLGTTDEEEVATGKAEEVAEIGAEAVVMVGGDDVRNQLLLKGL